MSEKFANQLKTWKYEASKVGRTRLLHGTYPPRCGKYLKLSSLTTSYNTISTQD